MPFGLFFIDLDKFKLVNDTYGHDIGDEYLKILSNRLQENIRGVDTLARVGGDEFCIIVKGSDYSKACLIVANKIKANFSDKVKINGIEITPQCSIGISIYPADTEDRDKLMKFADVAMYKAKEIDGNEFRFYSEICK